MYARMHVNVKTMSITIGEVIHGLNIMKCMDSDIVYVIHVYNDIWNATNMSKAKGPGPGPEHGLTELVRNERVEGNAQYMDEARGYMERVSVANLAALGCGRSVF